MIEKLKSESRRDAGTRLRLRRFHDTLLYGGTMPVSVRAHGCSSPTADETAARGALASRRDRRSLRAADPTPTPRRARPSRPRGLRPGDARGRDASATVTVSGASTGSFAIELLGRRRRRLATANFVALARCGFYDGIWFHRVLAGFVIQAGDPGTKTQTRDFGPTSAGGPGTSSRSSRRGWPDVRPVLGRDGERHGQ
jgi:hypothetical protein